MPQPLPWPYSYSYISIYIFLPVSILPAYVTHSHLVRLPVDSQGVRRVWSHIVIVPIERILLMFLCWTDIIITIMITMFNDRVNHCTFHLVICVPLPFFPPPPPVPIFPLSPFFSFSTSNAHLSGSVICHHLPQITLLCLLVCWS